MNEEMKVKLAKYMKENGYYDLSAIAKDEYASEDDALGLNATMALYFGDDSEASAQDTELLAVARAYNVAKSKAEEKAEIETALAKNDAQITESEWRQLINAGLAEQRVYAGNDHVQGGVYYIRKVAATQPASIPTEEELAQRDF